MPTYRRTRAKKHRTTGGHTIKANGKRYNINLARIVLRCGQCHSALVRRDFGLVCAKAPAHRGLIHRDEVKRLQELEAQALEELHQFYEIKGGRIVPREG